jgi:FlaA1/EpsC-like NDP-sugar epimerase
MMLQQLRNRNFYLMVSGDMVLFVLAHAGAYLIRFDFELSAGILNQILSLLPVLVLVKTVTFLYLGLYRGMWRYSSLSDVWKLLKATILSSLVIVSVILFLQHFHGYSRGVFVIDAGLTFLFTGGLRIAVRLLYHEGFLIKTERPDIDSWSRSNGKPVILVGAGDAGEKTFRELMDNPSLKYRVVGFVDDDQGKRGRLIHGVPVRGPVAELPRLVTELGVQEILITLPSATGPQMRRAVDICKKSAVPFKTLPGLGELIDGKVSIKALRDVSYDDLLGRKPVKLDLETIRAYLKGKRVLVTGAGGSIGSELCRQIVKFRPETMVMIDSSEANLYAIQTELKHRLHFSDYVPILANVQYAPVVNMLIEQYRPQVIVHAAAYKHVPMMEENPWEAVFNNVVGTRNIMEAAATHGTGHFVMVSTDKAVRPTNVMGATKRICELLMQTYHGQNGTVMMCVRFGNVIGSSGSVVPLFKEQIARGGPVTVTDPDVTRYFMTIPEASQLILQAGALGEGGEIFILKMGTPVKIAQMASDLISLSGKEPGKDIEIVYTGLRPGEKLYEELITEGEGIVQTSHKKIMVLRPDKNWNGHWDREAFRSWLMEGIEELQEAAMRHDGPGIRTKLRELVPEYQPGDNRCVL